MTVSGGRQDICTVNADGTGPVLCNNGSRTPSWSPAGDSIAFDKDSTGIWRMDPDFSNQQEITSGPIEQDPSWSSDGTKIVFSRLNFDGSRPSDIIVMDSDGNNQVNLTNNPTNSGPIRDGDPDWRP